MHKTTLAFIAFTALGCVDSGSGRFVYPNRDAAMASDAAPLVDGGAALDLLADLAAVDGAAPDLAVVDAAPDLGKAQCLDGVKDGDETDVDCGGLSCAKCAANKGCLRGTDCSSGFCTNL